MTGLDLSPFYLAEARGLHAHWEALRGHTGEGGATWVHANAEAMPLPDASFDAVSVVYLLHELPPASRARVAAEVFRVLRPGGVRARAAGRGGSPCSSHHCVHSLPDQIRSPWWWTACSAATGLPWTRAWSTSRRALCAAGCRGEGRCAGSSGAAASLPPLQLFNEPEYDSFIEEDLGATFAAAGLQPWRKEVASATKGLAFVKPRA